METPIAGSLANELLEEGGFIDYQTFRRRLMARLMRIYYREVKEYYRTVTSWDNPARMARRVTHEAFNDFGC